MSPRYRVAASVGGWLMCRMDDLTERLRHKVVPAAPVPFDAAGNIQVDPMERYAGWVSRQSIGAVALWAHTGRGLCLSAAQRSVVLSTWLNALGDTPVICGVGTPESAPLPQNPRARTDRVTELAVSMAVQARDGGAAP